MITLICDIELSAEIQSFKWQTLIVRKNPYNLEHDVLTFLKNSVRNPEGPQK